MTIRYTPKQVSESTGVSLAGIRNYTARYTQHFSAEATPPPGMPRWFTEDDIKLVAFIASKTKAGHNHEQVVKSIEAGELADFTDWQIAASPTDAPQEPQEEDTGVLVTRSQAQAMQALIQDAQRREQSTAEENRALQEQLRRLERELGQAQGALDQAKEAIETYKAGKRRPRWWVALFGGE